MSHSGEGDLRVPNLTVKKLMYEYLGRATEDADVFSLDFYKLGRLVRDMACDGAWEPVFAFWPRKSNGKPRSGTTFRGKGRSNLSPGLPERHRLLCHPFRRGVRKRVRGPVPGPFRTKCLDRNYAYLIEIKYASRSGFTEAKKKNSWTMPESN